MQKFKNPFNIESSFDSLTEYWSPKIIIEFNGQYIKIAKLKGEFVWHKHEHEDELFMVIKGNLTIDLKDKTIYLKTGDSYIVPKGALHNPHCKEECWVMLIEPKETLHTGSVQTNRSKSIEDQLG